MDLNSILVSEFAKITNDNKETVNEGTTVYGTYRVDGDGAYVQIDGSDTRTPVATTSEARNGDRVTVLIKNHRAIITGNLTDPSTTVKSVEERIETGVGNANMEPVFFAYPDDKLLDDLLKRYASTTPEYDFIAPGDGFRHQFWVVSDEKDIALITDEFKKMPSLYIADGHHRSAAAALVGAEKAKQNPHHTGKEEYNYFMAVCFPASQLTILDYNRVVKDLNGYTPVQFLKALDEDFIVDYCLFVHL